MTLFRISSSTSSRLYLGLAEFSDQWGEEMLTWAPLQSELSRDGSTSHVLRQAILSKGCKTLSNACRLLGPLRGAFECCQINQYSSAKCGSSFHYTSIPAPQPLPSCDTAFTCIRYGKAFIWCDRATMSAGCTCVRDRTSVTTSGLKAGSWPDPCRRIWTQICVA